MSVDEPIDNNASEPKMTRDDSEAKNNNNEKTDAEEPSHDDQSHEENPHDDDEQQHMETEATDSATRTENNNAKSAKQEAKGDDNNNNNNNKKKDNKTNNKKTTTTPKAKKKKYLNWPMRDIKEYHENDVLYGRGGGTNHHPGNKRYRKMVEDRKLDYVNSKRLDKPLVALDIIRQWREQEPPGRFLKLDEKTGLYHDVGDKKAREKTSQALREKAPLIRKLHGDGESKSESEEEEEDNAERPKTKTTRFAAGTHPGNEKPVQKAVLARDHSLGREYLQAGEAVTLEGFSWEQDPFMDDGGFDRMPSQGSVPPGGPYPPGRIDSQGSVPPGGPYPHGRVDSQGSMGVAEPPPHFTPASSMAYSTSSNDERQRQYSMGRYESWGSLPPPMPGYGAYPPERSGSWSREHSLSRNPLRDASISGTAPHVFDASRGSSGYWEQPPMQQQQQPGSFAPPRPPPSNSRYSMEYSGRQGPPSPPYSVDPAVAQTWSTGISPEVSNQWVGEEDHGKKPFASPSRSKRPQDAPHRHYRREDSHRHHRPRREDGHIHRQEEARKIEGDELSRPQTVKRMTSHQYETTDTKKDLTGTSVKRAALNRDNSLAANRLKGVYMGDALDQDRMFDSDREMRNLSGNLQQTTLEGSSVARSKPMALCASDRVSTIDKIAMDLMVKPEPLTLNSRSSTIEALSLDFDDDPMLRNDFQRISSELADIESLSRPPPVSDNSRLSSMEFVDMLETPIGNNI